MASSTASWTSKFPNTISRINGYDDNAFTYYPVIIVGAGESGIAMGCRLKQVLGCDQFRIFERQAGVGGTWWINRYPGVACDIPALFYSFSFCPNKRWSSFHPAGPEIVKYLNDVCSKFEITDKIQCNTSVQSCKWLPEESLWEVELAHMAPEAGDLSAKDRNVKIEKEGRQSVYLRTETVRAKVVVSAVGGLVEPRGWPDNIPGLDTFEGDIFHSARWRYDVDLKDKDVVVIGTGCSAAQFVPRLTKAPFHAKSVKQLMRSPPWVVPRVTPPFGNKKWEKYSPTVLSYIPGLAWLFRTLLFLGSEYDMRLFGASDYSANERSKLEKVLIQHLKKTTPKEYHAMLTPDYGVGCKRRIFDASWFPSLSDPRIDLTTQPLQSVQAHSVTLGAGQLYPKGNSDLAADEHSIPADAIILANGFDTTRWLHPLNVRGKGGQDLVEEMDARGGPQAYQGTAMDGFPNFFMIFGPNTATGHSSVILATENMVNYSLKFIGPILSGDVDTFEVKREAEEAFTADVQRALQGTVTMSGGCMNWYHHNGWNSTLYPYTQIWFGLRCMFPTWSDWNINYTRKGIWKRRIVLALRVVTTCAMIIGAYRYNNGAQDWKLMKSIWRNSLRR